MSAKPETARHRVVELWGRYKRSGDGEATALLVKEYAPLVRRALARLARGLPTRADLPDLASSGVLGLLDAISRYEPDRDVRFEAYAALRIHGAMVDHLRSLDWLPRTLRRRTRAIEQVQQRLEIESGRRPGRREIAARAGLTPDQVEQALLALSESVLVSLDESPAPDGPAPSIPLRESLPDTSDGPEQWAIAADLRRRLAHALKALPERSRRVIALCYFRHFTLRQAGAVLGLSEASICHIRASALRFLRERLDDAPRSPGLRSAS